MLPFFPGCCHVIRCVLAPNLQIGIMNPLTLFLQDVDLIQFMSTSRTLYYTVLPQCTMKYGTYRVSLMISQRVSVLGFERVIVEVTELESLNEYLRLPLCARTKWGHIRSLKCNNFGGRPRGNLLNVLMENHSVHTLILDGNFLDANNIKYLTQSVKINASMRSLSLYNTGLSEQSCNLLCESLKNNTSLTSLNVGDNPLGCGVIALAQTLTTHSALTSVSFCNCIFPVSEFFDHLGKFRASQNELSILDFRGCRLGSCDPSTVAAACGVISLLSSLDLSNNGLTAKAIIPLCEMLKSHPFLTTLKLGSNEIGDDGATFLSEAIRDNHTLKLLDLAQCRISSKGGTKLAQALSLQNSITCLKVHLNDIGPIGATEFASALQTNLFLKTLSLASNKIKDEGALALAHAIHRNESLTELHVSYNFLLEDSITILIEAFQRKPFPTYLDIRDML